MMIGNMVDGLEILSKDEKLTWFKVALRPANADHFLTYVVGAGDIEAIKSRYSPENGIKILNISMLNKDGSSCDENEWLSVERRQFIKQICGSFYTLNDDELQVINEMLEAYRKSERKLISALIKNYLKTGDPNILDDPSLNINSI